MEKIALNRDLVLGFRKKGLTYYEIAEKFVSPYADAKLKKKQTDQLMCMDGGIIDICENPDGNPTDLDGMKNLSAGVIMAAINDYGEAYTFNCTTLESGRIIDDKLSIKIRENGGEMKRIEEFFASDLAKTYLAVMEGEMHEIQPKQIIEAIKNQAKEGRWIDFGSKKFARKHQAVAFANKYPKYSKNYEIKKIKSSWRLVHKKTEEVCA